MLNITDHATQLLLRIAAASGRLSLGTLESPQSLAGRAPALAAQLPIDQWWLCANVPAGMFRVAERSPLRHLGKVVRGDAGTQYVVLAQQAGPWQNRLVLQLAGKQMREYVSSACEKGFVLSLGLEGGDESLVIPDCRYAQDLVGTEVPVPTAPGELCAIAREACRVAVAMLSPEAVREPGLEPARSVCVSLVASSDVVEQTSRKE